MILERNTPRPGEAIDKSARLSHRAVEQVEAHHRDGYSWSFNVSIRTEGPDLLRVSIWPLVFDRLEHFGTFWGLLKVSERTQLS